MQPIHLKNKTAEGVPLEAIFHPAEGMSLVSYRRADIDALAQETKKDFEATRAGLGVLIGPHFYHRNPQTLPKIENPSKFPVIQNMIAKGAEDPLTHGIGRYAPWNAEATETTIRAELKGDDEWNGVKLKDLEGQDFRMRFGVRLAPDGLHYDLSVVSDTCSIVGIHYYYNLPNGEGTILSKVQNSYLDPHVKRPIPKEWDYDAQHNLTYPLNQDTDFNFKPYPNPLEGLITLQTPTHQVVTRYSTPSEEGSWQLWHPKGASFVCIEPNSAQDPRHTNLTVSSVKIHVEILPVAR